MEPTRTLDCVALKTRVQRELQEEWRGLTDEEVRRRIRQELESPDNLVAKWWRSLDAAQTSAGAAG